ncbi:MAG TPA: large conductance mechanosensitive channel protein MscL [Armatimonadaceae bacterium]|nr:large conductance mechanosensitive channel protein MscL [Armatimonadaceae bacterium]
MSMLSEFKEFAAKGNVVDLAVGVIIGAAFGKITSSLVDDVLMPVIGRITSVGGGTALDFKDKFISLDGRSFESLAAAKAAGAPVLAFGNFINQIIYFLIVAFAMFLLVKGINAMRRAQSDAPEAAPEPSNEEKILMEIRDAIKGQATGTPTPQIGTRPGLSEA